MPWQYSRPRTLYKFEVQNAIPGLTGAIPDLTGAIPDLIGAIPDLPGSVRDLKFVKNARSRMLPGQSGSVPDLKTRGPEHCQVNLAIFRTSNAEVRNAAREVPNAAKEVPNAAREVPNAAKPAWQHSGHQILMPLMLPGRPGSIRDLNL